VTSGDKLAADRVLDSFFRPLVTLRDTVPGYAVSLIKAGVRLSGMDVGSVRPPLVDPAAEDLERLAEIIAAGKAAVGAVTTAPLP
jgi:5-dehydro-4-deoxyglucarate dehydratase